MASFDWLWKPNELKQLLSIRTHLNKTNIEQRKISIFKVKKKASGVNWLKQNNANNICIDSYASFFLQWNIHLIKIRIKN